MVKKNHTFFNPASEIDPPKIKQRLPRVILNSPEVDQVLKEIDFGKGMGIRDRAILETFYSQGIRRLGLINLKSFDIDEVKGTLLIREG